MEPLSKKYRFHSESFFCFNVFTTCGPDLGTISQTKGYTTRRRIPHNTPYKVCILGKPRLGHPSRACAALTKYPLQGPRRTARTDYYERYRHSNFPHHPTNCLRHDTAGSQVPFPLELEHAAAILNATQPFESAGSRVPSALLSPALRLSSHHGDFSTSTIVLRGQREK